MQLWRVVLFVVVSTAAGVSAARAAESDPKPDVRSDAVPEAVRIEVQSPNPGELVRGRFDMMRLAGLAEAGERQAVFDVVLVVDVSASTAYPSGVDVDGDGVFGVTEPALIPGLPGKRNTDPEDSILAAEITAAERLLESLEPQRVRVGLVSFSGFVNPVTKQPSETEPSARVEHPLSDDFDSVRRALQAVLLRGASGGTDMQAGLKLAVSELAGLEGAQSASRPGSRRVVLLLTDGLPSLPFGEVTVQDPEDIEATVAAGQLAADAGVLINVFGLGPRAGDYPQAAFKVSQLTGGSFVPVRKPGDVVTLLSGVSFAEVADVVAVNLTLGQESGPQDIELLPDGSFRGFVPVAQGLNRIRVSALASDGTRGSTEFEVTYQLQDLSDTELRAELDRVRDRNRDIQILTERRRQDAFRRQERERALTLEVENDEDQEDEETNP